MYFTTCCRSRGADSIMVFQDEASGCCCTWTKDPVSGVPYLCVGGVDAKVKIYNVFNGELVEVRALNLFHHFDGNSGALTFRKCFIGHGGVRSFKSMVFARFTDDFRMSTT